MRTIDLDASGWKTVSDFYEALLPQLGAPPWHGQNVNALDDSVIWGGINAVEPPFVIRVFNLHAAPKAVVDEVELAKRALAEGRENFRTQHDRDLDVQLQIMP